MTPTSQVCWENVRNEKKLQHPQIIGPSSDVPGRTVDTMKWSGQATHVLIKVCHSLSWALCPKLLNKHCWIPNTAYFVCMCIHCILTPCLLEEIIISMPQSKTELFYFYHCPECQNLTGWNCGFGVVPCCGFWRLVQISTAFLRSKSSDTHCTFF